MQWMWMSPGLTVKSESHFLVQQRTFHICVPNTSKNWHFSGLSKSFFCFIIRTFKTLLADVVIDLENGTRVHHQSTVPSLENNDLMNSLLDFIKELWTKLSWTLQCLPLVSNPQIMHKWKLALKKFPLHY